MTVCAIYIDVKIKTKYIYKDLTVENGMLYKTPEEDYHVTI